MNYSLNCPSLEYIALVQIATTLWNQDDIRALMSKFNFDIKLKFDINLRFGRDKKWQEVENKIIEKVPQLSLPESLKEEILGFIKPVGLRILDWLEYHQEKIHLQIGLPSELCWTPQGTVDLKKTAEALMKDESLDVISRYKLACTYCFEDDVLELWNKIPENRRESLYSDEDPIKVGQQDLVDLWMYNINDEVNKLDDSDERERWQQERRSCSPYQYAFQYAAEDGNIAATEYFFQKLTSREREESLVRTADNITDSRHLTKHSRADVLCFLLSQMDEEKQILVFIRSPDQVLCYLLEWPWQSLFMETANRSWDYLDEEDYESLLEFIVSKVKRGLKDYDYQMLFREFWQQSPNIHKRYVIDESAQYSFLLSNLLAIEDKDNFKLILKDATLTEKRKLIFSVRGQEICAGFICDDEWDLLQFFIRECISSKEEMVKFTEEFEGRMKQPSHKVEFPKKKDKFFQLLDDFINGYNKRKSVAEGDSSPAKRLHISEFEEVTHSMKK